MEEPILDVTKGTTKQITWSKLNRNLFLALGVIFIIWYLRFLWGRRKLYIYSWKVPGPFVLPLIGCTYWFFGDSTDIFGSIKKIQERFPTIAKVWIGTKLVYVLNEPGHIEKVLTNPKAVDKDDLYRFMSYAIGSGLLTAPAIKWRKHRKLLMPAFNQRILDNFVEIFSDQAIIFKNQLKNYVGRKDMDISVPVALCTLDIICETAMGLKMNVQTTDCEFTKNLDKALEIVNYRICHIWHHLEFTWPLYPLSRELSKLVQTCREFSSTVIRKKLEEHEERVKAKHSSLLAQTEEDPPKRAFLDLILEKSDFVEEELREEVDLFMIAGSDSTASSLCALFVMLGMFQDIQQKVYEEIIDVLGQDRPVLPSDLPKLTYTERVIKETLRLFPVAPYFSRAIGEDIDLGDVIIPAGTTALFALLYIHKNPKYWPDPQKFDPDRFLPENVAKRHPCAYIPFSHGPRNCIGAKYALMNMKTILATVIREFKFFTQYKTIEEIELRSGFISKFKDGPKVWVEVR